MTPISPGLAQGCLELLEIVARQQLTFSEIRSSFAYFGSISSQKVAETAQALNWLETNDSGYAQVTPNGAQLLSIVGYEAQLRKVLLDYIDIERPSWVQSASFGRSRVISFAGSQIAQVFVEAGLTESTGDAVISFWDELASRARGQRDNTLVQIGRIGERLTIAHEKKRTGKTPKWISVDNNADGYDVLSIVSANNPKPLTIEVKTSTQGTSGLATITRNEWEMATESDAHVFHFWDIRDRKLPKLIVIDSTQLFAHMPIDQGEGKWENTRISFSIFYNNTNYL
ncbi:DUF3883 domain-containing protein [Burkholderia sp. MSMB1072]|uniref:DUF3883 domain-containing protein n=1 Tax=Burkholderia sp. MSMB1072 TaxID=1637871 RepID=UPI000B2DF56D|nr:DUF3883 domain-containing protein [Burkholderia sp. MSMB1072]